MADTPYSLWTRACNSRSLLEMNHLIDEGVKCKKPNLRVWSFPTPTSYTISLQFITSMSLSSNTPTEYRRAVKKLVDFGIDLMQPVHATGTVGTNTGYVPSTVQWLLSHPERLDKEVVLAILRELVKCGVNIKTSSNNLLRVYCMSIREKHDPRIIALLLKAGYDLYDEALGDLDTCNAISAYTVMLRSPDTKATLFNMKIPLRVLGTDYRIIKGF